MWCPWVASGQGFIQPLAWCWPDRPLLYVQSIGCTPPASPRIARVSCTHGGPIAMPQGSAACTTYWLCPLLLKARKWAAQADAHPAETGWECVRPGTGSPHGAPSTVEASTTTTTTTAAAHNGHRLAHISTRSRRITMARSQIREVRQQRQRRAQVSLPSGIVGVGFVGRGP